MYSGASVALLLHPRFFISGAIQHFNPTLLINAGHRFGDGDGMGADALLQHPLAVLAMPNGTVYVADSYNHKIKAVNPVTNSISAVSGTGRPGFKDGPFVSAAFSEPGGLAQGPGASIIIADTNNSVIRVLDPLTGTVKTLPLEDVPPPRISPDAAVMLSLGMLPSMCCVLCLGVGWAGWGILPVAYQSQIILAPHACILCFLCCAAAELPEGAKLVRTAVPVAASGGTISLTVKLPAGYHYTKGANSSFACIVLGLGPGEQVEVQPALGELKEGEGPAAILTFSRKQPSMGSGSEAETSDNALIRIYTKIYYCQMHDVCLLEEVVFDVPLASRLEVSTDKGFKLDLLHSVHLPGPD